MALSSHVKVTPDGRSVAVCRLRKCAHCENPRCTGDIDDRTDNGAPILEIDHIHDLALGGDDDPLQMIALCPNCHAAKTRGTRRAELKPVLLATAKSRHERLTRRDQELLHDVQREGRTLTTS